MLISSEHILTMLLERNGCSAALIRNFLLPFYLSILAVSLIAGIIWYRLITDFTQSVPGAAESSFGDSLNFILLLWVLFARFFWFRDHFIPLLRHVRAEDPRGLVSGNPR